MYSRSYPTRQGIPESYGGTALREEECYAPESESVADEHEECGAMPRESTRLPDFLSGFGGFFDGLGLHMPKKIGMEEILIGAIALFLIFSDEKDIVLGALLLLLIFID